MVTSILYLVCMILLLFLYPAACTRIALYCYYRTESTMCDGAPSPPPHVIPNKGRMQIN